MVKKKSLPKRKSSLSSTLVRAWLTVLMMLFFCAPLGAEMLVLKGKNLLFQLDDRNGRFYMENTTPKTDKERSLLFKDVPPTSYITLIYEGYAYKLNDSKIKTLSLFKKDGGRIQGKYGIGSATVTITFTITNLTKHSYESIICRINIHNTDKKKKILVGSRILLDTAYGEVDNSPSIYLSSKEPIRYDRQFFSQNLPNFILSGVYLMDEAAFGRGLFIYPRINELIPEHLIIGNWKKLDVAEIAYTVNPNDNFKYNQYANRDAAVAIFYENITVKPKEKINIGCVLSLDKVDFISLAEAVEYPKPKTRKTNVIVSPTNALVTDTNKIVTNIVVKGTNAFITPTNIVVIDTNKTVTNLVIKGTNTNIVITQTNVVIVETNIVKDTNRIEKVTNKLSKLEELEIKRLEKQLEILEAQAKSIAKLTELIDKLDNKPISQINQIHTNTVVVTNYFDNLPDGGYESTEVLTLKRDIVDRERELDNARKSIREREKEYQRSIEDVNSYYKELLKKKESEYRNASEEYRKAAENTEKRKKNSQKLKKLEATIRNLNEKIAVTEELLDMDWDFENMTFDRIQAISEAVDSIAQGLD